MSGRPASGPIPAEPTLYDAPAGGAEVLADLHGRRCAACGHVYVEGRDVPMSRCPRCDRINEAVRR